MKKLLIISALILSATCCHRKAIPTINNSDSTFVERRDSVVSKDTVIDLQGQEIGLAAMIDSLVIVINKLKLAGVDSSIYVPIIQAAITNDTVHAQRLSASLSVNSAGNVKFICKEDSLKQVIKNLTTAYLQLYVTHTKVQTIQVPGPVQLKNVTPKWAWVLLAIAVAVIGWKITSIYYKPATTGLSFLTTLFKWKF